MNQKESILILNENGAQLIRRNKKLLFFPIINSVFGIVFFVAAVIPLLHIELDMWKNSYVTPGVFTVFIGIILLYFFLLHLISVFCGAGTMACALQELQNKPSTIHMGFCAMINNAWRLFFWKVLLTTVGPMTRFLEYWVDDFMVTSKLSTQWLNGLPWMSAALLTIPVLVNEKRSAINSMKRSAELMVNAYGKKATLRFRTGTRFLGLRLIAVGLIVGAYFISNTIAMITLSSIGMILFLYTAAVSICLKDILIAAIYLYVTDGSVSFYADQAMLKNIMITIRADRK